MHGKSSALMPMLYLKGQLYCSDIKKYREATREEKVTNKKNRKKIAKDRGERMEVADAPLRRD